MAKQWLVDWAGKYETGISHCFIMHLGVKDLLVPGVSVVDQVVRVLCGRPEQPMMEVVATYDRAHGFTFPSDAMKKRFIKVAGLEPQKEAAPNPFAGLLGGPGAGAADDLLPTAPGQALPLMELVCTQIQCGIVILDAETIFPNQDIALLSAEDRTNLVRATSWGTNEDMKRLGSSIILMTEQIAALNVRLRQASSKYDVVRVDLPDRDGRRKFIDVLGQVQSENGAPYYSFAWDTGMDASRLANLTAGLTRTSIQDIYLRARKTGKMTYDLVHERKRELIAAEYGEVLDWVDPRWSFDAIGGHEHVKKYLLKVAARIKSGKTNVPKGFLLAGPAGTGKSVLVEAFAGEVGFNMVSLNMARIMGSFVGQSEQNLEKAITAIKSLSPCIVFLDEIDQKVSRNEGSSGDSGVGGRMFSRLMEFLADPSTRGQVIAFAASNRTDLIDAAFRRPGRFDVKLAILPPDPEERVQVLAVHLEKRSLSTDAITPAIVSATEGYTQAELERLCEKTSEVLEDGEAATARDALALAAELIVATTADVQRMTNLALREVDDASMVPAAYRAQWKAIKRGGVDNGEAEPAAPKVEHKRSMSLDVD